MNYGNINTHDIANGQGVRVSLFVSGCRHNCEGCFNKEAQKFSYGEPFGDEQVKRIVELLKPNYIKGLTILGGEPMEPENQMHVLRVIEEVRSAYGDKKDIWLYTGAIYEDLIDETKRYYTPYIKHILRKIDVLVDGPFILSKRDIQNTPFRGSTNQRLIDVRETIKNGVVCNYPLK